MIAEGANLNAIRVSEQDIPAIAENALGLAATTNKIDDSWYLLKNAVYSCGYRHGKQPYKLIDHGKADDLGIRGECWISVPKSRSEKILQEAKELVGKEIEVTVQLRRYSFAPKHGSLQIQGVSLSFVSGLTALKSP